MKKKLNTIWKKVAYGIFALVVMTITSYISVIPYVFLTDLTESKISLTSLLFSGMFIFLVDTISIYLLIVSGIKRINSDLKKAYSKIIFYIYVGITFLNIVYILLSNFEWLVFISPHTLWFLYYSQGDLSKITSLLVGFLSLALIYYLLHRKFNKH